MPLKLTTYYHGNSVPELPGTNTFHSTELFHIYEATPGYKPMLIVASEEGQVVGKLLAVFIESRHWWYAPFFVRRCDVIGTGEYFDLPDTGTAGPSLTREYIFGEMLQRLTAEAVYRCFYVKFRNLEDAKFGYKVFRDNRYFAVNWLRVRNSLHTSRTVEEQCSQSRLRQIRKGLKNGAEVGEVRSIEEIKAFARMLWRLYSSTLRCYIPNSDFFHLLQSRLIKEEQYKIFVVRYKGKIIGGSVCIYSDDNAYLWFSGGMRKTYALQYPGVLAVWKALDDARQRGYRHMEFMDVGLPFRKHGYREFVLRFGGKQVSTRRWFRFRWNWLNRLLGKFYE